MTDKDNKPSKETLEEWSKNPDNWILGIFYFNRKDKRIFPPKRIDQFGWTVNFANPISVLAIVAIIVATILITKLRK
jgi:uncharacterized membrane protein